MATWEYTTHVITHGFLGRKEEELDRGEFEEALAELGAQGWELGTGFLDAALHREKDGHVLLFKGRVDCPQRTDASVSRPPGRAFCARPRADVACGQRE